MKSTAKKQSVYYHVTQFGDAAKIMQTGLLRGGQISVNERKAHLNAGIVSRGYFVSLARSLSSSYVADNIKRDGETFCVLMIDTDRIRGRFRLEPINFYGDDTNKTRKHSEYEERLIFDSKELDVSNAVVGIVLRASPDYATPSQNVVRIPRKFFPFLRGRDLFYITAKNYAVKRPLNLKVKSGYSTLSESVKYNEDAEDTTKKFKVLTTDLKDVAMLPSKDLAKYVLHCFVMLERPSSAEYNNPKVYEHINQMALRSKTQPEMVMHKMIDISTKEFVRRANSLFKEYVGLFANAVKRARRMSKPQYAFADFAYDVANFVRVFDRLRKRALKQKFAELEKVYYNTRDAVRGNKPKEMSTLSRSTSKLELERGFLNTNVFHDDQEFDLESLKDFVFADSPKLREILAPYIDALYRN